MPEVASRRHVELVQLGYRGGARPGPRATSTTIDTVGVTRRARVDRRAPRRGCRRKGPRLDAAAAARARRRPPRPRRVALPPAAPSSSRRSPACSRAAGRHAPALRPRPLVGRRDRPRTDAGRRCRRGLRQRRAPARPSVPGGAEIDLLAAAGDPEVFLVSRRPRPRAILVLRPQDGELLLYAVRGPPPGGVRRADLAAGYQRAIVRALVARGRVGRSRTEVAIVGGVAANSELRQALLDAVAVGLPCAPTTPR